MPEKKSAAISAGKVAIDDESVALNAVNAVLSDERTSAIAMALARRTYLYRFFHVVFGSRPNVESVAVMFGSETLNMLTSVRDDLGKDGFASLAARTLGASERSFAVCVEEACACVERIREEVNKPEQVATFVESLRASYDKLFQVPGEHYVHPWESPYTGRESVLFQESTLDVRAFYHAAGFKLQAEKHFPDDHIAAMMDYLGALSERAWNAFAEGCNAKVVQTLASQQQFLDQHVLAWVDRFAAKALEHDTEGYYGAFAGVMAAFVALDRALIEQIEMELGLAE